MLGKPNFSRRQVKDYEDGETCSITIHHHWSVQVVVLVLVLGSLSLMLLISLCVDSWHVDLGSAGARLPALYTSAPQLGLTLSFTLASTSQPPGAVQAQVLVRCHTALYMCHYTLYALNTRTQEYSRTKNMVIIMVKLVELKNILIVWMNIIRKMNLA